MRLPFLFLFICSCISCVGALKKNNSPADRKAFFLKNAGSENRPDLWFDSNHEDSLNPDDYSPKEIGTILFTKGKVIGTLSNSRVRVLKKGSKVLEGEVITTKKDSECIIELYSPSPASISLQESSSFKVSQRFGNEKKGPILGEGKVIVKTTSTDFKMETPVASANFKSGSFEVESKAGIEKILSHEGNGSIYPNSIDSTNSKYSAVQIAPEHKLELHSREMSEFIRTGKMAIKQADKSELISLQDKVKEISQKKSEFATYSSTSERVSENNQYKDFKEEDYFFQEIDGDNYFTRVNSLRFFHRNPHLINSVLCSKMNIRLYSGQIDTYERFFLERTLKLCEK